MSGGGAGSVNLCFYSNKCQWSKAFITELARTPWSKQFRFICVDPGPSRPQLPGWLKKVPTLVVAGESEPRTDSDVMNWLYEKKMKEGGGGGGEGGPQAAGGGEPEAFSIAENTSFARGFSYSSLDADTSTAGDGGSTMPGAFSFLGGAAAPGDRSANSFGGGGGGGQASAGGVAGGRRSKKEELFDKQMEQYQRERNAGMPSGPMRQ